MKKIILWIVIAVIAIGAALGVFFTIRHYVKKDENPTNQTYRVDYLNSNKTYVVGESIIFRVLYSSDVKMSSMTYVMNNAEEESLTVKTGESVDADETVGNGKFYVDTGAEVIETTGMAPGIYTFVFYTYDVDASRYIVNSDPIIIKIVAAA